MEAGIVAPCATQPNSAFVASSPLIRAENTMEAGIVAPCATQPNSAFVASSPLIRAENTMEAGIVAPCATQPNSAFVASSPLIRTENTMEAGISFPSVQSSLSHSLTIIVNSSSGSSSNLSLIPPVALIADDGLVASSPAVLIATNTL